MRALPGGVIFARSDGWFDRGKARWVGRETGQELDFRRKSVSAWECEVSRICAIFESCKNASTCFELEAGFSRAVIIESARKCTVL